MYFLNRLSTKKNLNSCFIRKNEICEINCLNKLIVQIQNLFSTLSFCALICIM